MGYAALFSGGKDSALALWKAQSLGLKIDFLITVYPEKDYSYMFHKPNLHLMPQIAKSLDIELIKIETSGKKEKEMEELKEKMKGFEIDGIITGAVASNYQMARIENLASEHSLDVFAPLWNKSSSELIREIIEEKFKTIIVSVSARGLDETWLGRELDENCFSALKRLKEKYGINISGEGGEYETLVLDAPNFSTSFHVTEQEPDWDGKRGELKVKIKKKR